MLKRLTGELAGESVERGARAADRAEVCNALSTHVANLRATRRSGGVYNGFRVMQSSLYSSDEPLLGNVMQDVLHGVSVPSSPTPRPAPA